MSAIYPMARARAIFGSLVRRAAHNRERITITDHGHPAAVLISQQELTELEDAAALAEYRARQATGTLEPAVSHHEVRRRLGIDAS
jgi:prevent-host-death family protein